MTNWGKVADFSTFHYIAKHYIKEAEKKKTDQLAYLIVVAAIVDAD